MARTFDGTDDRISIAGGLAAQTLAGMTVAAIARPADGAATRYILGIGEVAGSRFFFGITASSKWRCRFDGSARGSATSFTAGRWYFIAVTKATGTTTPRAHWYDYTTNAWVHENLSGTAVDMTLTGKTGLIGASETDLPAAFWSGDIAAVGLWETDATDAEIEASGMAFSLQSWHHFKSEPRGLWLLDQALTTQTVEDISGGGANQSAITGTAVATSSVPVFGYGHQILTAFQAAVAAFTGIPNLVTARR